MGRCYRAAESERDAVETDGRLACSAMETAYQTFDVISWHIFVEATKDVAIAKVLSRASDLLGVQLKTESVKPYWKNDGVSDVRATTVLAAQGVESAVFELVGSVGRLAHGFESSGIQTYENGGLEMACMATSFRTSGLRSLEASVRNF